MLDNLQSASDAPTTSSRTLRSIAWNYAGYFYQIAINLGVTSYIVRRVSVAEYGLLLFVMSLSATLYLLDIGISSVLVQAYVEALASSDRSRPTDLLNTVFLALSALGSLGLLIISALAFLLPGPFNIPHQLVHEAFIIFILAALAIQVSFPSMAFEHLYQATHRFDRINQIQLICSTVQAALSILALAAGYGIVALALVQLVASTLRFVFFVAALPKTTLRAHFHLTRFNWNLLKPLISMSRWAFLNNISACLFDMFVWIILGSFGSMKAAALFGLASKAPKQLWNLVDRGAGVALPMMSNSFSQRNLGSLQATYLKTQKLIFGAVIPFVALGCMFARPLIQVWVGSQYLEAAVVMRWLLLAALSHAVTYSSDLLLYACAEVRKAAKIAFWSGALSIGGALILVSRFGAAGMAAALGLTQLTVNCTWFTVAACERSQISLTKLLSSLCEGLGLPLCLLAAEIVLVRSFSSRLSPLGLLLAATVSGAVYLAFWGAHTALPLYRGQLLGDAQ